MNIVKPCRLEGGSFIIKNKNNNKNNNQCKNSHFGDQNHHVTCHCSLWGIPLYCSWHIQLFYVFFLSHPVCLWPSFWYINFFWIFTVNCICVWAHLVFFFHSEKNVEVLQYSCRCCGRHHGIIVHSIKKNNEVQNCKTWDTVEPAICLPWCCLVICLKYKCKI